jgi:ABC-type Na+ efflux pump permease subunit
MSLFNQNLKGLVYIAGLLIASVINIIFMNIIGSGRDDNESFSCSMFDIPNVSQFNSPYPTSLIIAFTLAYLSLPMKYNKQMNYIVLIFLLGLLGIDVLTKVQNRCTTYAGSILGALVGFLLGSIWYVLFFSLGYSSLLYFDELRSDNVQCSMPTKQTFKCSVYKNGELVSSNIAWFIYQIKDYIYLYFDSYNQ